MAPNMNRTFVLLLLLASGLQSVGATLGVDVSEPVSEDTWSCIAESGNSFAIVQTYQSTGEVDANAVDTVKNAKAGGIIYIDGYLSPCFPCGNPAGQVSDAIRNLDIYDAIVGQLWLSVEEAAEWSTSCDSNIAFIQALVDEADRLGITAGIYASQDSWTTVTCSSTAFSYLQLWYSSIDGSASFGDFTPFGGWARPAIKQYKSSQTVCGIEVNQDFY